MFTIKNHAPKEKRKEVNRWIRKRLENNFPTKLVESAILDAMEVECNEPGCAPLEVLIILGFPEFAVDGYRMIPHKWGGKILKPMQEVTEEDVINLEIPLRCLNSSLVELDASLDKLLTLSKVDENNQDVNNQLLADLSELLTEKLALINSLKNPVSAVIESIPPSINEVDEVTPVFMTSTLNPSVVSGPSAFVNRSEKTPGTTTGFPSSSSINSFSFTSQSDSVRKASDYIVVKDQSSTKNRHEKGTRPRGCPCCDPDNLDNIIDKMLFMDMPPI